MISNISGVTACGKRWRCVCADRKHPDGKRYLVLIDKGSEEIVVAVDNFADPIKSQWFPELVFLVNDDHHRMASLRMRNSLHCGLCAGSVFTWRLR